MMPMTAVPLPPSAVPRARRRRRVPVAVAAAVIATVTIVAGIGIADVILQYRASTSASGTPSPFRFVNGGNYAVAHGQGLFTTTYPNAAQVSVSATMSGANGAFGSYLLDVLEVQAAVTSATGWHLRFDVSTALVATGLNAAYVFYCTAVPTTVPDTGAALAAGTDANGNPWAIFAPTCAGTQVALPLTATGTGTLVAFATLTTGTMLFSVSFGLAVTNTGAVTTTPAVLTLFATSP